MQGNLELLHEVEQKIGGLTAYFGSMKGSLTATTSRSPCRRLSMDVSKYFVEADKGEGSQRTHFGRPEDMLSGPSTLRSLEKLTILPILPNPEEKDRSVKNSHNSGASSALTVDSDLDVRHDDDCVLSSVRSI